jgi:hypothetical protein
MLPKDGIFDPPLILCFSAENNVPDTNYYPPRCVRSSSTKPLYRGDDAYPSPFLFHQAIGKTAHPVRQRHHFNSHHAVIGTCHVHNLF